MCAGPRRSWPAWRHSARTRRVRAGSGYRTGTLTRVREAAQAARPERHRRRIPGLLAGGGDGPAARGHVLTRCAGDHEPAARPRADAGDLHLQLGTPRLGGVPDRRPGPGHRARCADSRSPPGNDGSGLAGRLSLKHLQARRRGESGEQGPGCRGGQAPPAAADSPHLADERLQRQAPRRIVGVIAPGPQRLVSRDLAEQARQPRQPGKLVTAPGAARQVPAYPVALTRLDRAEHIHAELAADLPALPGAVHARHPGRITVVCCAVPMAGAQAGQTSRAAHGSGDKAAGQGTPGVIPGGP